MKRGFTLIELLVVITVIGVLAGITMMTLYGHENRASDNQARSLLADVRSGVEEYFSQNNEYPLASLLYGGSLPSTCAAPASYATASSTLNVSTATLSGDRIKLAMCSGNVDLATITDTNKIYYITKPTASDATALTVTNGGCTFTLAASDMGNLSYFLVYYAKQFGGWHVIDSSHGSPTTSNGTLCPFDSSF